MTDAAERVKAIITEALGRAPELVTADFAIADDVDRLAISLEIAAEFEIGVSAQDQSDFTTVGAIIAFVERSLTERADRP